MDRNDYYGGAAASLNLNQVSDCVGLSDCVVLTLLWIYLGCDRSGLGVLFGLLRFAVESGALVKGGLV